MPSVAPKRKPRSLAPIGWWKKTPWNWSALQKSAKSKEQSKIMAIVININSGKDFEPVSEGVHAAVLAEVVDKGICETQFGPKHKVMLVWLTDEADEDGKTKYVFQSFTASLHEKAGLRKAVKAIRGKDIDGTDFDIESLKGSQ